jgi:hypothetical protein
MQSVSTKRISQNVINKCPEWALSMAGPRRRLFGSVLEETIARVEWNSWPRL